MITHLRKKWLKIVCLGILVFVGFGFFNEFAFAMPDPTKTYCQNLGFEWKVLKGEQGETAICIFPDGSSVDSLEFLQGKVASEYSYCAQKGYELKTISDWNKCSPIISDECAVCVLADKREIEVSELMKIEKMVSAEQTEQKPISIRAQTIEIIKQLIALITELVTVYHQELLELQATE
jgi:putative hemolysin